jgi:EAL domain-containing protein (putative c-di-GMP-specific phosphodiesterase class I)
LGGDEFALLLAHADAPAAAEAARRIQRAFEQPMEIDDQTIDLGTSIGIALFPAHGRDAGQLVGRAELAMYLAKRQRSGSQFYEPRLDAGSQESLSLLGELRQATSARELRLYLQPKIHLQTGQVVAAEALLRWQHPQRGLVMPGEFIPFAEQTGFIRQLTAWVIDAAARAAHNAHARGVDLRISVNLSARDLMDQDLPAKLMAVLQQYGTRPQSLCLEITESAIMDDPQRAMLTLEHLRKLGFWLSIDDFGTGYSSLAYLKRLAVDELKIDKSFVMAMERDLDDAKIVRSTIELAHNLGLTVVAEGIETARTWKLLAALGCDEGQGYYIARPMPEDQLLGWLAQWQLPDAMEQDAPASLLAGLD